MAQSREIEATTSPEESNTGGDTFNKTSDDGGDPNNNDPQPPPRSRGTAAQSREIDAGIEAIEARSHGTAAPSRGIDAGIETIEARSRERNAEPMTRMDQSRVIDARIEAVKARSREKNAEPMAMAQSREIEATTSPEDSNTGGRPTNHLMMRGMYFASPQHHIILQELWLPPSHRTPTTTPQSPTWMKWSKIVVRPANRKPRR